MSKTFSAVSVKTRRIRTSNVIAMTLYRLLLLMSTAPVVTSAVTHGVDGTGIDVTTGALTSLLTFTLRRRQFGHADVVKFLLGTDGVNANQDDGGEHYLTPLFAASEKGHAEVVALLLKEGRAKVNLAGSEWAPLAVAKRKRHQEIIDLLIANGAEDCSTEEENSENSSGSECDDSFDNEY